MKGKLAKVTEEHELYFSNNFEPLLKFLEKYWNIKCVKPKDYNKFLERGEEQQPHHDYKAFDGFDTGTAGSFNLPQQISPQSTVFSELHNGDKPYETLLSAIYGYAYQIGAKSQELKYKKAMDLEFERISELDELSQMGENGKPLSVSTIKDMINNVLTFKKIV